MTGGTTNVVVTTSNPVTMLDGPDWYDLTKWQAQIEAFQAAGTNVNPLAQMTPNMKAIVNIYLSMLKHAHQADWETLVPKELFRVLREIFPKNSEARGQNCFDYLTGESKQLDLYVMDQLPLIKQIAVMRAKLEVMQISAGDEKHAVKQLIQDISQGRNASKPCKSYMQDELRRKKPDTINEFFDTLLRTQHETRQAVLEVIRRGVYSYPPGENPDGVASSTDETHPKRPRHELPPGAPPGPPQIPQNFCKACGRAGHGWDSCAFKTHGHPDHNPDSTVPWRQSTPGDAWLKRDWKVCPVRMTLSGKHFDFLPLGKALRR